MTETLKVIQRSWNGWHLLTLLLLPLAGLFCLLTWLRRGAYRVGWLRRGRLGVPVVIVGNISVGGTGKTPLVVWMAECLVRMGRRPGVLLRGYGGRAADGPREVGAGTPAKEVGDEALLIKRRTRCPVFVGRDRVAAGKRLLERYDCDLILSDDGLQHYALERDVEVVVVDGERRFGNGLCLPAGPLREGVGRLGQADLVIVNGGAAAGEFRMEVTGDHAFPLAGGEARALDSFRGEALHAVAGIGHPERFFGMLRRRGLRPVCHAFPDHHPFREEDLAPFSAATVLMTEKDAVKCELFAQPNYWYVPAAAQPDEAFQAAFEATVKRVIDGH